VSRLKTLSEEYQKLRARLEQGGGAERIKRQHDQGKLTARERVTALLDKDGPWVEIGLLVAWDQYGGRRGDRIGPHRRPPGSGGRQ